MKKCAIVLSILFCFMLNMTSCSDSQQEAQEKAALDAFEAMYINKDFEAYFAKSYICNQELFEKYLGDDEKYNDYKAIMLENRERAEKDISGGIDEKIEKRYGFTEYSFDYKVTYSSIYEKGEDMYDSYTDKDTFEFFDSPYADAVEATGVVAISSELHGVRADGSKETREWYHNLYCYRINGEWYINTIYTNI